MTRLSVLYGLCVVVALAGCTRPDRARQTLAANGYTDIEMQGYAFFECSDKDTFADKFTARSPAGITVSGAVCSGLLKGSTIRFD